MNDMNTLERIFAVIKEIHGEDGHWSSKRVYGAILIIIVCVCVLCGVKHDMLEPMLYTGAGLIGLATTVQIAQALKNKPVQDSQIPES